MWFTDGGLCNNFPVQLFDAALPTRPTFAINLGRFDDDADECEDERTNLRSAPNNSSGITPRVASIPHTGRGAVTGFAGLAFNAARNWSDVSQLDQPGYRDRIVEVLQTKSQGGMNLDMDAQTIDRLAARGAAAGDTLTDLFNTPHYNNGYTGWANHRWVRYRATLSALPDWLASFKRGLAVLDIDPTDPPAYRFESDDAATLAVAMASGLETLASTVAAADGGDVTELESVPNPKTILRRVPML